MRKGEYRIHIQRGVGMATCSISVSEELRDEAVAHAKELFEAMPEPTFQGDGISITTVPRFGPGMDE
jgi:hypothetical protein